MLEAIEKVYKDDLGLASAIFYNSYSNYQDYDRGMHEAEEEENNLRFCNINNKAQQVAINLKTDPELVIQIICEESGIIL